MGSADAISSLARQAGVSEDFARKVVDAGAVAEAEAYGIREVRRVRLLRAWEDAGLSAELVMRIVDRGLLSLAFLDTPVIAGPGRLDTTYTDLALDEKIPLRLVQRMHESLGFAPPTADDQAHANDPTLIRLARMFLEMGATEDAVLRLFRVYADSLRRLAKAEAELFETEIEQRLRAAGMNEQQLLEFGANVGERIISLLEDSLIAIYRRHREHIWIEHSTNHAEVALDQAGLQPRAPRMHTICFVDLTGYTRLTEERGDEYAAHLSAELTGIVEDISFRRRGRPIRWLGDGGMFHFRGAGDAVQAALDMVEAAPRAGLPPTHIGVHTGPVIFQDGDVYGRTVNLAARLASHATAGEVLVSDATASAASDADVTFDEGPELQLKGIDRPVPVLRASRGRAG